MKFTEAATFEVEGARVGIITCLTCGAALFLDPRDDVDVVELHRRWHHKITRVRKHAIEAARHSMRMK